MRRGHGRARLGWITSWLLVFVSASSARGLTITEIMYDPSEAESRRFEYIEIFNENPDPLDLSGFRVCDGVLFEFPQDTFLDGFAFLVICADEQAIRAKYDIENTIGDWLWEGESGVSLSNAGEDIEICNPGGAVVARVDYDELSEARVPDGGEWRDAADPTRRAKNRLTVNSSIVINEIMYHPIGKEEDREFIELFHRGGPTVDLTGWEFTNGVRFAFPAGQILSAGEFFVVARNPETIRSIYGLSADECIGPVDEEGRDRFGVLRDRGERVTLQDELGRTVDTVRYYDGGEWPRWADGHGSSLELIDSFSDNRVGMAWDASDDSGKAPVEQFSYIARHRGEDSELHLLLLSRGITVVDNVSVLQGGIETIDSPIVDAGESWRYFRGRSRPPADWNIQEFLDTAWDLGATPIGYGDGPYGTVIDDMQGEYASLFCRHSFTVRDVDQLDSLLLAVEADDGFIEYLNGVRVASFGISDPSFDALAACACEPTLVERDISGFAGLLEEDRANVLAIQIHNTSLGSSDLTFAPRLVSRGTTNTGDGTELLANSTFDSNTSGWAIEGTHIRSGRTTSDAIDGAGALKIVASGRGDNKVNRIESTNARTSSFPTGTDLLVSFDAKWQIGSKTLNTHGYKHAMAKTHDLAVPDRLGTPGAPNSVTLRRIREHGGSNLGPVLSDYEQIPAVPIAGEAVTIRCRVDDVDGISSVRINFSVNNPSTNPSTVAMRDIGGGLFEGAIPGRPLDQKVVFFIEAEDASANLSRYPVDVNDRSHPLVADGDVPLTDRRYFVYRHDEARHAATPFQDMRFYMTEAKEQELSNRKRLSNDVIDGTFSFGGHTTYQESGIRFSGSPWARGQWNGSLRVRAPRSKPIHGWMRKFNLEDHHGNGADARERIAHYLLRYNQGCGFVPYSEAQSMARIQVNDRAAHIREQVWVPDIQYLDHWFGDAGGDFLEMDDRFVINDNGDRAASADGRLLYPPSSERGDGDGENKENYRWFHGLRSKNGCDDYTSFIALCRLMDPGATSDKSFAERVWDEVNVEEFLRIMTVRHNISDWDQWSAERGKNTYFYLDPKSQQWHLLAWDMELTFETGRLDHFAIPPSITSPFRPSRFSEVNHMFENVEIRRLYYGILDHMVYSRGGRRAFFTSDHLSDFADRLLEFGMANTNIGLPGGYVDSRSQLIRSRLGATASTPFEITTNGGEDFAVDSLSVSIAGTGPARLCLILVSGESYPVVYPSLTTWLIDDIPLGGGPTLLELVAINLEGDIDGTDSITVTSTIDLEPPIVLQVDPPAALPGEIVRIFGGELISGIRVFFGEAEGVDVERVSANELTVRVPDGEGEVLLKVRNVDGQESGTLPFSILEPPPMFIRGDANGDGDVNISDALKIVFHLFRGSEIPCADAADTDDDEELAVTDAISLLDFLYRSGPVPASPFPLEGVDPSGAELACDGL